MSDKKTFTVKEMHEMKFQNMDDLVTHLTHADDGNEESSRGQVYEIVSDLANIIANNSEAMKVFSTYMGNKVKR